MSVDMDYVELDSILDDCLERMRRGEDLESCLATHPDHAEELQSLLTVATDMTQLEVPRTSQQATEAGRRRMFEALETGQSKVSMSNQTIPVSIVGIIRYLEQVQKTFISNLSKEFLVMHKTVIALVLVLVLVFGGSAASAYAAQGSLPGDALYPMKTAIENASVDFSMDSASEVRMYLQLAEKRIMEIESLAAEGRYEDVEKAVERFESHVEKAIKGLLIVAQGNPAEAETLAVLLGDLMDRHARVLLVLMVAAPDGVQATFEDAVEASQEGISAAGEYADDGEANENGNLNGGNEEAEEENENLNSNEEEGNANESEEEGEDSSEDENSNENGEDESENENTGGDDDEGNLNGDDDDDEDEDENVNGDHDDEEDEDENTNGDDEDESDSEDENTNSDDEDESEDENTNGDDDSEENSNENESGDENADGEDESNENGDSGEVEDGINENGDDSSEDGSDDANENDNHDTGDGEENSNESGDEEANENDNTGEDEDSSDEGDESGNENDSGEEESNENDNSDPEEDESDNDNSVEDDNSNS